MQHRLPPSVRAGAGIAIQVTRDQRCRMRRMSRCTESRRLTNARPVLRISALRQSPERRPVAGMGHDASGADAPAVGRGGSLAAWNRQRSRFPSRFARCSAPPDGRSVGVGSKASHQGRECSSGLRHHSQLQPSKYLRTTSMFLASDASISRSSESLRRAIARSEPRRLWFGRPPSPGCACGVRRGMGLKASHE
jgi:hypothetical protein